MDLEPAGPADQRRSSDDGHTLVEVVVAVVLIAILVLSAAMFLTTATARTAVLQQQQTAPLVATQAMARVKAVTPSATPSSATGLVQGRNPDDVAAQWSAAASVPALSSALTSAWPVADPIAASGSTGAVLPLRSTVTVGSTTYVVATYLGVCDQQRSATTAATCTKSTSGPASAPPPGSVRLVRALVEVSWTPRAASGCPQNRCSYLVTSLVDPHPDLTWIPDAAADTEGAA